MYPCSGNLRHRLLIISNGGMDIYAKIKQVSFDDDCRAVISTNFEGSGTAIGLVGVD